MTEPDDTDCTVDRHLSARQPDAPRRHRRRRSQIVFGALAVLLCLLLGVGIATQVRQTESGDALDTARPADLLVLLDSLQQREAALNTEVAELQRNLASMQTAGSSDQAAIQNAQARLAALSILIGTVGATGPGVTITIDDPAPGRRPRDHARRRSTSCAPRAPRRWRSAPGSGRCGSGSTPGWSARRRAGRSTG